MRPDEKRLRTQLFLRSMRLLALVMVFGVTALFSLVPFKVPRVMFFAAQAALHEAPVSEPGLHAMAIGTRYEDSATLETVLGRYDLSADLAALLPAAPLFAGTRAVASLSVWKARRIALPVPVHIQLRAPPALG